MAMENETGERVCGHGFYPERLCPLCQDVKRMEVLKGVPVTLDDMLKRVGDLYEARKNGVKGYDDEVERLGPVVLLSLWDAVEALEKARNGRLSPDGAAEVLRLIQVTLGLSRRG